MIISYILNVIKMLSNKSTPIDNTTIGCLKITTTLEMYFEKVAFQFLQ
jgi:hypothetical protein